MNWKFWKRNGHRPESVMARVPMENPEVFAMMACEFVESKHWQFLLLMCQHCSNANVRPTANPNDALAAINTAAAYQDLPNIIMGIVNAKRESDRARQRDEADGGVHRPKIQPVRGRPISV